MMHPLSLWMNLASSPNLTAWGRGMLMLPSDEALDEATAAVEDGVAAMGLPPTLAVAYAAMYPLVKEQAAIQDAAKQMPALHGALPDVTTPQDAAALVQREYRTTPSEAQRLVAMLPLPGRRMSKEGQQAAALWPWTATKPEGAAKPQTKPTPQTKPKATAKP